MWDSLLIFIATNPFSFFIIPTLFGLILLLSQKKPYVRMLGCIFTMLGVILGGILNYRWDSFTVSLDDGFKETKLEK